MAEAYQALVSEIIREAAEKLGDKFKDNVSLGRQSLIKEFMDELVSCGELTELNRERIEKNPALNQYFPKPIEIKEDSDDKASSGDTGFVEYDYDGYIVLWNKESHNLHDMDNGSVIGVMKCDDNGDWYPVPDEENDEVFEGRTTFPDNHDVNLFIIRYIKKEWPELELCPYPGDGWVILNRCGRKVPWPGYRGIIMMKFGDEGIVSGTYSDGKEYKINLKGKMFGELDELLCII